MEAVQKGVDASVEENDKHQSVGEDVLKQANASKDDMSAETVADAVPSRRAEEAWDFASMPEVPSGESAPKNQAPNRILDDQNQDSASENREMDNQPQSFAEQTAMRQADNPSQETLEMKPETEELRRQDSVRGELRRKTQGQEKDVQTSGDDEKTVQQDENPSEDTTNLEETNKTAHPEAEGESSREVEVSSDAVRHEKGKDIHLQPHAENEREKSEPLDVVSRDETSSSHTVPDAFPTGPAEEPGDLMSMVDVQSLGGALPAIQDENHDPFNLADETENVSQPNEEETTQPPDLGPELQTNKNQDQHGTEEDKREDESRRDAESLESSRREDDEDETFAKETAGSVSSNDESHLKKFFAEK